MSLSQPFPFHRGSSDETVNANWTSLKFSLGTSDVFYGTITVFNMSVELRLRPAAQAAFVTARGFLPKFLAFPFPSLNSQERLPGAGLLQDVIISI
jgi:hypothetical protein